MDKKLKEEMKKAESESNDMLPFMDDDSELAKKCLVNIDSWMKEDSDEFFNKCLKKLGLCEKKGLDGQLMLYPIKGKERKLEKEEFIEMMNKLYTVKQNSSQYVHLNERTKEDMVKGKEQSEKMNATLREYSQKQMVEKMNRAKGIDPSAQNSWMKSSQYSSKSKMGIVNKSSSSNK